MNNTTAREWCLIHDMAPPCPRCAALPAPQGIESTLAERAARYGSFKSQAGIAQKIKSAMQNSANWHHLEPDMKETLDLIANKIGRILNGDPNYIDSWHDIIGYARLIEKRLEEEQA